MSLNELFDRIDIARQYGGDESAMLVLRRYSRAQSKTPQPRPVMPTFNFGPRKEFTELRPRHLLMVEELGVQDDYNREKAYAWLMENYHRLFGPLRRSKALEVPSDQLRKEMMISRLLGLVELRREEIAANVLPGGLTANLN